MHSLDFCFNHITKNFVTAIASLLLIVMLVVCCSKPVWGAVVYDRGEILFAEHFTDLAALQSWTPPIDQQFFRPAGGPDGQNAVQFIADNPHKIMMPSRKLKTKDFTGLIWLEAKVRQDEVTAEDSYLHSKLMLVYSVDGKKFYPEPYRLNGNYPWLERGAVISIPDNAEDLTLVIGLQGGQGKYTVADIVICQAIKREVESITVEVPENPLADTVPLPIPGLATTKYRGAMLGSKPTEKDIADLAGYGGNLVRYQMQGKGADISTQEKYLQWIDAEIITMEEVRSWCEKYGLQFCIDLHNGPGTVMTEVSSNLLESGKESFDTLVLTWEKIAKWGVDKPNIYGYDLLNEPVASSYIASGEISWREVLTRVVKAIRVIDPDTAIIIEPLAGAQPRPRAFMEIIDDHNIIYSPHFYSPHAYSHQGVLSPVKWAYPGYIGSMYWDKEMLRVVMKDIIDFQHKTKKPIFIGEFSCSIWSDGGDKYLADCIEIFEEYGWDWAYHAFREWNGWSFEHELNAQGQIVPSADNPRKDVLVKAFQRNQSQK